MSERKTDIKDLDALAAFTGELAGSLQGGEVIGLVGDLGAGKTTLVQRLARELGVEGPVRSPTFILMQPLATSADVSRETGIRTLCHLDAYRLEGLAELQAIGFEDYAGEPDTVTVVEWADRVPEIRKLAGYQEIELQFGEGEARILVWRE